MKLPHQKPGAQMEGRHVLRASSELLRAPAFCVLSVPCPQGVVMDEGDWLKVIKANYYQRWGHIPDLWISSPEFCPLDHNS